MKAECCKSGFRLQRVPGFGIERADNRDYGQVAGQLAAKDKLGHVRLIFDSSRRTAIPTVQFQ